MVMSVIKRCDDPSRVASEYSKLPLCNWALGAGCLRFRMRVAGAPFLQC